MNDIRIKGAPQRIVACGLTLALAGASTYAPAAISWPQFGGDSTHSNSNNFERIVGPANVQNLRQITANGSAFGSLEAGCTPVIDGTNSVAYVTTNDGNLAAFQSGGSGTLQWEHQPWSYGQALEVHTDAIGTPAIDPSLSIVYVAGADGYIHAFASKGSGAYNNGEIIGPYWPQLYTAKPKSEGSTTALTIAVDADTGNTYLYVGSGNCDDDDCQGHVTVMNITGQSQNVYDAICSNLSGSGSAPAPNGHIVSNDSRCDIRGAGVWARAGVTFDPLTQMLYVPTGATNTDGNGFSPPTEWDDSILKLNPDGSGVLLGGQPWPIDSYTPTALGTTSNDLDLGSTNILVLPRNGSIYPHLGLTSGKDGYVRLLNLDNMGGGQGLGRTGGELYSYALSGLQGTATTTPMATWINPMDDSTWVFFNSYGTGTLMGTSFMNALKIVLSGGSPTISEGWAPIQSPTGSTSVGGAFVANGVVYYTDGVDLRARSATTGTLLWSSGLGINGTQTPVLVNGVLFMTQMLLTNGVPTYGGPLRAFSLSGGAADPPTGHASNIALVAPYYDDWGTIPFLNNNTPNDTFGVSNESVNPLEGEPSFLSTGIAVGDDFNGDGSADVAVEDDWSSPTALEIAIHDGSYYQLYDANSTSAWTMPEFRGWLDAALSVVTGDFDGDGRTDIALVGGSDWTSIPVAFSNSNWAANGAAFNITNITN